MHRQLVIECGVAQTRAALLVDEEVRAFWFGPARGDEGADQAPLIDREFIGKVTAIDHNIEGGFIDIGLRDPAFLNIKSSKTDSDIVEGAYLVVRVRTPPRQQKGAVVRLVRIANDDERTLGRHDGGRDAVLEATSQFSNLHDVICDDGPACAILRGVYPELAVSHEMRPLSLFQHFGIDDVLEQAFDRRVPLKSGGALIIEEAEACVVIDVDSEGSSANSNARLREKLCIEAAREAARQIQLRSLAGPIVIDFPSLSGDGARTRFQKTLKETVGHLLGASKFGFAKSGLYSFIITRRDISLLERWTEPCASAPVAGRIFTADAKALSMVWALEAQLRSRPEDVFDVVAGDDIFNHARLRPVWFPRLDEKYAARCRLTSSPSIGPRDYAITTR